MAWSEIVLPVLATLFVVIDPPGLAPLFLVLTQGDSERVRRKIAVRSVLTASSVLVPFALLGDPIFRFLGVSMPAFRIAGGLLLFLIAVEMLFEKRTERREKKVTEATEQTVADQIDHEQTDDVSAFPLGVPLIAGPGAIASIILLMSEHKGDYFGQAVVLGVLFVVLGITLALLILAGTLSRYVSPTILKVVTRVFGIILAALSVQFVITGLKNAGF